MALQGTLDTFALPDVLRLLAATRKTGRLLITGAPGSGSAWVDEGKVVAVDAEHAPHAVDAVNALFELLRFEHGSFTFEADVAPQVPGAPMDPEALVTEAEGLLSEWREIERVVPSMDAWVTLRRTLAEPEVTIGQELWTTVVAIAGGATVRAMCDDLELAEMPMSRTVRDLSQLGLVDIEEAAPPARVAPDGRASTSTPDVGLVTSDAPATGPAVTPAQPVDRAVTPESDVTLAPAPADDAEIMEQSPVAQRPAAATPTLVGDSALPTARPLRARRPKGAAHLSSASTAAGEPERFVPLDLPGQGPQLSYDPLVEPEDDEDRSGEAEEATGTDTDINAEGASSSLPGLGTKTPEAAAADGNEDAGPRLAPLGGAVGEAISGSDASSSEGSGTRPAGAGEPGGRGLLVKLRSSVKS